MNKKEHTGKVILAGAGPGDPELLTLKAARYLELADVIITDRLVSELILEKYARKDALILHAGKQSRKEDSTPQSVINELLVEYALQGKLVVRLKGGDASIFSNILDELQALAEQQIPYEIIPGITAASGAAAYAGIPLTARNYANAIRLLTYYKDDLFSGDYWKELASTNDTLVFYMSSGNLDALVEKLLSQGIAKDKFISVIEQATTPEQKVCTVPIHEYLKILGGGSYCAPTLVIIGKVAALNKQFQWLPNSERRKPYFQSIEKNKKREARA